MRGWMDLNWLNQHASALPRGLPVLSDVGVDILTKTPTRKRPHAEENVANVLRMRTARSQIPAFEPLISIGPCTNAAMQDFGIADHWIPRLRTLATNTRSSRWAATMMGPGWDLEHRKAQGLAQAMLSDLDGPVFRLGHGASRVVKVRPCSHTYEYIMLLLILLFSSLRARAGWGGALGSDSLQCYSAVSHCWWFCFGAKFMMDSLILRFDLIFVSRGNLPFVIPLAYRDYVYCPVPVPVLSIPYSHLSFRRLTLCGPRAVMLQNDHPATKLRQGHVPHKPRPKMSKEARQQVAARRKESTNTYAEALEEASGEIKTIAAQVAETHHKTIHEVKNALYLGPGHFLHGKHRTRSAWHTFQWKRRESGGTLIRSVIQTKEVDYRAYLQV